MKITLNDIKKGVKTQCPKAEFFLKNEKINGNATGAIIGFIQDGNNFVYVNANTALCGGKHMYRKAAHLKDYTGERNRWIEAHQDKEAFVSAVSDILSEVKA